jgi:uncharacterized protein
MTTPPHLWNPCFCGDSEMRIASNGIWYHQGSIINRPALVKLFASILRHTPHGYELVTPVERMSILVEDAPFIATTMHIIGKNQNQQLKFTTNIGDEITAGANHPLRFDRQKNDAFIPYCLIRDGLWAKLTRTVYTELVDIGEKLEGKFGVWSDGVFFYITDSNELE